MLQYLMTQYCSIHYNQMLCSPLLCFLPLSQELDPNSVYKNFSELQCLQYLSPNISKLHNL